MSPPGGTVFDMNPVTGGKIRIPSRITAWRYGSLRASESVIGLEMLAERSSERRAASTRGNVAMYRRVARMAVAEVSEPATLIPGLVICFLVCEIWDTYI